jgi:hypothetical protein
VKILPKHARPCTPAHEAGRSRQLEDGSHYSAEEVAFMFAVERWMRQHRARYPSSREVLRVAHALGYRKEGAP